MKPKYAGIRTAAQVGVAFIASGAIVELFNIIIDGVTIEPTLQMSIAFVLTWLVAYIQNDVEERGTVIPGLTKLKHEQVSGIPNPSNKYNVMISVDELEEFESANEFLNNLDREREITHG